MRRASTWVVCQPAPSLKASRNLPVLLVGLPKANHRRSVSASGQKALEAVSQMIGGIAEASSKIINTRRPWLCKPANASGLRSLHAIMSVRQVRARSGSTRKQSRGLQDGNRERPRNSRYHLASSTQVFVFNCVSVFAVTTPRVSVAVDIAHRISHATVELLPTPWPDATASKTASSGDNPSPTRRNKSACHGSGPGEEDNSPSPHGKTNRTNPSGSPAYAANASISADRSSDTDHRQSTRHEPHRGMYLRSSKAK